MVYASSLPLFCVFCLSLSFIDLVQCTNCTFGGVDLAKLDSTWISMSDDGNITYKISLCKPVIANGHSDQNCHGDTSVCMHYKNGTVLSAGNFSTETKSSQGNDKGELWLVMTGDRCLESPSDNMSTLLGLKCGPALGGPKFLEHSYCVNYFLWETDIMCTGKNKPVINEVKCYLYDDDGNRFDLSPLAKKKGGYHAMSSDGETEIYINVCRDIVPDGDTANCINGSGACAKVKTGTGSNRNMTILSAGKLTDPLRLATDKRLTLHYGSDTKPDHCTYAPSTTINFVCPKRGGSKDPIVESDFNCQYVISWETEYACPEATLTNKSCILTKEDADIDIDLTPLRKTAGSDHPYKVNYTDSDGTSYVAFLNVCEELKIPCPDEDHVRNIAACQLKPGPNNTGHSMGSIHEKQLRYADGELTLTYKGGDKCNHNNQQRTTIINFICNKTAENDGNGKPVFSEEDDCTYIFDWGTKYACTEHPVGEACDVSYGGNNYDLSRLVMTEANWVALQSLKEEDPGSYFINVCHDVLSHAATSGCKQGSAICYKDGGVTKSLGQYASAPVYEPDSESIQLTYSNGDSCGDNKHISSVINFFCKPGHLESRPTLVRKSADSCLYEFEWQTAAACKLGSYTGSDCKVSDATDGFTFDLSPLRKVGGFYKVTNDKDFDFLLNVCGPLTGTKCDASNITDPGICQVKKEQENSESYVIGQYSGQLKYFDGLIKLIYTGGTPYHDTTHTPRTAEIAFRCNSTVGAGAPQYMSELNHTYLFEWYTSYACPEQAIECTATDTNTKDEYDLTSLSHSASQGNWIVEGGNYRSYYINVCRKLNRVRVGNGCAPSAAVCRTKLENGQEKIDIPDMGHVTSGLTVTGEGRLELTYTSTALCNNTSNYVTHMQFVCERSASVTVPSVPKQDGPCEYTILWNTPAACPLVREVETESCTMKDPNSDYVFNLQPLTKKDGFYNVSGQDSTFKLNICGNLNSDVCGSASSVCSIKKDGTKTVISSKSGRLQFSEAGHMSLLYEGTQRLPNGQKVDVIINFECDRSIDVGTPEFLRKDTALYIFTFKTALACPPTPVECLVQDGAGHEYDLSTLYRPNGWTAYDASKGQTYFINVCRPISNLTATNCPAGPIGGCQLSSNGHSYNMGYIQSKPVARSDGTVSLRYMNGDVCHKGTKNEAHRSTRINFFCSGVNGGLMFLTETETCEYVFTWNTPAACPLQKTVGSQCKVIEPLFNFEFNLNPLRKAAADYHVKYGDYEYILNVCGPLNEGGVCGTQYTAACQRKPNGSSFTPVDAGKANSTLVYSGGELTLTLSGGQDNCHGTYTRQTVIKFKCDHSTDGKNGSLRFIEESQNCQYLFDWPTRYACPPFNTGQCSVKGPDGAVYDLTSLGRTNDNYETTDTIQHKRYVINVCRSLVHKKDTTCPYNAAACMIDTNSTDATHKFHSIGEVNSHQVQIINGKLLLIYDHGDACAKNQSERYTTHIHLKCDKTAQESSPTGHFMVGDCAHHFMWSTPAACPISGTEPVPTTNATCKVTSPTTGRIFDLNVLKIVSGKPWHVTDGDNHMYEFNVCGSVVGSACGNASSLMGACQSEIAGQKRTYNAGNILTDIYYEDGIIILNYTGGDRCHGGQYERNTIISFVCSSVGVGEPVYIDETQDCTYYIAWHTNLVCESQTKCTVDVDGRTELDLSPLGNMPYQLVTSAENHELYYLSVCQPLKPIPGTLCPAGASACLVLPGIKQHLSLGKPRSAPSWDKDNKAVVMVYTDGSRCDENPAQNYSTRIIFKCKAGPHRGTPVLVTQAGCEYVFQWDTNIVCYDETPSEPTDFCGYKDPQTLAVYNFTVLHAATPYKVTGSGGKKFLINMCGPAEPTSTSSCKHAMVCSDGISYGEPKNYQVEKESRQLKLNYAAGEKCASGGTAQSHIIFSCDRSGLGSPEFSTEVGCYAVFTWKTSAVCPPVEDICFTEIDRHLYDLTMLTRDTGSWVETDADGNKYWINVCASVHRSPCDSDVGVCRQSKDGKPVSLGRASTAKELKMKNGTLVLEYTEGGPACTESKRRSNNQSARTVINFKCGKTYGGPVFVPRKTNADDCVFEFNWETKLACQVKKEEVHDVGGTVKDPRSGGVINLNPLLHKSFEYNKSDESGGMMTYKIQLDGKSIYCKDGVVCQQRNNKNQYRVMGLYTQRKLYMDDDILEVEYNSTEFCKDRKSQRPVSSVIQFRCNKTAPLNSGPELLYSSKDCMYVFSWETRVACLNVTVVIPTEGQVKGHSEGSSGGMQPKTIGAIVGIFLGVILICILLVVFHSADRRAAFVNRLRRIVGHKSSEYTQRDLMEIFKDVMKDSKPRLLFQSTETYVRCTGHVLSSMAGNELNAVPMEKYQQFYPFIQKLDFQNNFIERLPTNFFESFVNLEYLSVSNNQLVTLPNGLEKVKNLSYLDIAMNNILDLPANFDVLAGSLTYLNISDNPLSGLPTSVYKLTKLEELYAENIGEIDSFSEIKNLAELITLSLGRNEIKSVPNELGDLPLAYLDLSGVPWFEQLTTTKTFLSYRAFNQTLNSSTILKKLSEKERQELFKTVDADESSTLTANEVLSLNDVLCKKYHRFGAGSLDYSETGGIPPPVLKIKTLKTLILKYHVLKHIPDEIKDLTSLKELDLSHNPQITSLSAELSGLPLKMIHLRECPLLKTPPKEIVARGFVAVMGYLKRLRLGASPCKRTKLMLVGLGGAGKTSLVSALMNSRFRAYMDHDEAITDGIDISKWELPVKGEKDPLVFSVWDFAGQTVYYNTHQFFLSNRAVYLLLWNVRQGYEHAGLDFWLSSIACHAPRAPILVVGTHADKVEKCRLPEASIQARFPQITGFFYVSSYTGDGIPDLKKSIVKVALQQKYMGEKIPEAWLNLEKKLIVLREEQQKDFLPLKQLDSIAQSVGIFDKNELVQAIQFLHDLGAAQFFDTEFLRSLVVIYPQWIVDVMACLVTVHQGIVKDGRLELKDVSGVWADYPTDLHPWLLRLTEEFDLTCPLPDTETSIVPCLLPDAEPKYDWPHADPEKNIKESITIYKFQYLPAGLFNRAQARLHQYSEGAVLWKKGSFLKKNDHKAVLLQTDDSEVIVRAQGFRPENFLFLVHEIIETLITESYAGVHYDFLVPCLECLNMNVKDPSMVSYMKVQRALELNAPFLQCDKFFHILSIAELRDTMPSDKMSEIDNHLRSSVRELIDLESETTINVFFVYSTKNVPGLENENKVVHPGTVMEDLRKHSDLKIAFTDKPETSDMEGITLSVKSANVVIIGMSDEFCEDSECRKLLMYIKDVLRKPVLLLLLGKTKKWQKGDLNMVFGSEVYVDMQKIERYPHKIEELYEAIKKKAATALKAKDEDIPQCFISYCWSNSHDAIAKGSREVEGALGWKGGDPREVKSFLESKGIHCWLDIERVGGTGLFHSIADGLREAKTMLVFVSDEYVKSKNCIMEFRYALTTLRIPVIVCVVGTGYAWERSEVGLLVVGHSCPKINLQFANETGYLEVLKLVQEKLPEMGTSQSASATEDNQRNVAFQEVLELTQRKFLRHIYKSVSSEESEPYPRLMVVDFLREKERKDRIEELRKQAQIVKKKSALGTVKEDVKGEGEEKSEETQVKREGECSETEATVKADEDAAQKAEEDKHLKDIDVKSKYCFRLLCEYDQNWHESSATIFFPDLEPGDEQQVIDNAAPYLGRVYAILKHGKSKMECLNTPEGEKFQQKIEEICMKSGSDFYQEYLELRTLVMQQDKVMVKGKLQRCQVNGKTVWLCEEHKNASRSQTEQRYEDKFTQKTADIPIPTGELPDNYEPPEPIEVKESEEESAAPRQQHRKIFKKTSDAKPKLQRQTSQMCLLS